MVIQEDLMQLRRLVNASKVAELKAALKEEEEENGTEEDGKDDGGSEGAPDESS